MDCSPESFVEGKKYPATRVADSVLLYYRDAYEVLELAEKNPAILEYEQLKNLKDNDNPVLMLVMLKDTLINYVWL